MAGQAFKPQRILNNLVDIGVLFIVLTELCSFGVAFVLLVEDTRNRDVLAHDRRRQRFRQLLPHLEVASQDSRRILQGLLGLNSTVGDHLRNAVFTVLALHILDDLIATTFVKVNVEVGH